MTTLALVVAGALPVRADAPTRAEVPTRTDVTDVSTRAEAARGNRTSAGEAAIRARVPITLRGSLRAMERQHGIAQEAGYPFARTPGDLAVLFEEGDLVRLDGNDDYGLSPGVQALLARAEMRTFLERLSADYRAACGEKLIVTSLTRPITRQPPNAHRLSVHPAGIAVDLRVSDRGRCRRWLETTLLTMEKAVLLDVTREYNPPHYHVALFPEAYMNDLVARIDAENLRATAGRLELPAPMPADRRPDPAGEPDSGPVGTFLILPALGIVATGLRRRFG